MLSHLPLLSFRRSHPHTQVLWCTIHIYPAKIHSKVADQHKSHLTGYDPKVIELEDLEPRRIELGDYYQNPVAEHMEEFGKVGVETSYLQSQMHSECDSAESIADSDLEDGELRNMMASPLFLREREDNSGSSRRPTASGNQKQWQYRREGQVHNVLKLITQEEKA